MATSKEVHDRCAEILANPRSLTEPPTHIHLDKVVYEMAARLAAASLAIVRLQGQAVAAVTVGLDAFLGDRRLTKEDAKTLVSIVGKLGVHVQIGETQ